MEFARIAQELQPRSIAARDWVFQVIRTAIIRGVLPGGMPGTLNLEQSEVVSDMIDYCVKKEIPIGAICAAPSILGHKGLLSGKRATCYTGFEEQLSGAQVTGEPVEADGIFITARGAGVADRFAFALIERLISKERAALVRDAVLCAK